MLLVCVLPIQSAHEAAGATGTRHSPRPPWGRKTNANLGRIAPRDHEVMFGTGADTVIPGRCEASNPESRDSGSGPADHPGMTVSGLQRHCERSEAIHSFSPCGFMDCFASLAMTAWLFEN